LQEGGLNGRPLSALSSHYQIESCLPSFLQQENSVQQFQPVAEPVVNIEVFVRF